jgi:succinate-semialdehyde dehydrogenase/glutarate-semialdehyde dehydrogenase
MMEWTNFNPATGEPIATYSFASAEEIERGVAQLDQEFHRFKKLTVHERMAGISRLGALLRKHKSSLAGLMAQEMGKPIRQGLGEIEKCFLTCDFYAEMGDKFMVSQEVVAHYGQTWLVKRPLGVILAIMPWNFPFWQVIRCAVPAWLAGNVVLLKHAPSVQGCARRIQELVHEAFSSAPLLQIPMTNTGTDSVIADARVKAVSFTGSSRVGRHLASLAGLHLKKTVLELGGSDPYIILADADLSLAAELCVKARFLNSGQSCVAAKRFLIHQSVYSEFKSKVIEHIKKLKVGDPTLATTDIGPLAEERLRAAVLSQLALSVEKGAQLVDVGAPTMEALLAKGFFMAPTLVENLSTEMPLFAEETFGPVMPLMPVASYEQAIQLANQSQYGLGAAIFTARPDLAWPAAVEDLDVGMIVFNETIQSDPRVPFGGIKESGWGRELGPQGVMEFINLKTMGFSKDSI